MNSFNDRQKGFEAEFQHKQDLTFRVTARRNKLLGLWTAERLGIPAGDEAQAYAMSVVAADFEAPGDEDVIAKIRGDLAAKGVAVTEAELRAELTRSAAEAHKQTMEK